MDGSLIVYSCLTYGATQEIDKPIKTAVKKFWVSIILKKLLKKNLINPQY